MKAEVLSVGRWRGGWRMEVEGAARALALVVVAGTEDFFFPPFHASRHTGSYYDGLRTG